MTKVFRQFLTLAFAIGIITAMAAPIVYYFLHDKELMDAMFLSAGLALVFGPIGKAVMVVYEES